MYVLSEDEILRLPLQQGRWKKVTGLRVHTRGFESSIQLSPFVFLETHCVVIGGRDTTIPPLPFEETTAVQVTPVWFHLR
jgi:hypothetical protein